MTLGKLYNPSDRPSKWVTFFSFPSLTKKKSCFFIPRTWKQSPNLTPLDSPEFWTRSHHCIISFTKDFPGLSILNHIPATTTTLISPSLSLKPYRLNFGLSSPLCFFLEGSMRNVILLLSIYARETLANVHNKAYRRMCNEALFTIMNSRKTVSVNYKKKIYGKSI